MLPLSRALPLVLLGLFLACSESGSESSKPSGDPPGADRRTATVSPEAGGTLTSADGRLVITIPPGAVAKTTDLWVESVPKDKAEADFADAVPKGLAYRLGPDGTKFTVPASAALTLPVSELPRVGSSVPVLALGSRSAAGDEILVTKQTVGGQVLEEASTVMELDTAKAVSVIRGDVAHFSHLIAKAPAGTWWGYEDTANAQHKVGDEWVASIYVTNQTPQPISVSSAFSSSSTYSGNSCKAVEVIARGSACPGHSIKCCESLTGSQINPGGDVIHPESTLAVDPPARFRCASEGGGVFNLILWFSGGEPRQAIFATSTVECIVSDKLPLGSSCNVGADCASGTCVDGVCCESSCLGTCKSCNLPDTKGLCKDVPTGQTDPGTCNSPNACGGAGKCLLPNGATCTGGDSECLSGNCVGLTCCDTACLSACMECDVPGSEGTCTNVPLGGQDPDGCFKPDFCDGNGACQSGDAGTDGGGPPDASDAGSTDSSTDGACGVGSAPKGSPCSCASECASGFCVDGVCCNLKCDALCYSCSAAKKGSGLDGDCGVTKADTNPEGECPSTKVCSGGVCKPPLGYPCANNTECSPWYFCRDGVCCNNSFCAEGNAICTACTQAKTGQPDGTCATVFAGTDPFGSCGGKVCVGPSQPGTCQ